jgi:hypothetical protein
MEGQRATKLKEGCLKPEKSIRAAPTTAATAFGHFLHFSGDSMYLDIRKDE